MSECLHFLPTGQYYFMGIQKSPETYTADEIVMYIIIKLNIEKKLKLK